jgi:deazaflavin-dependent oxidoreductase (nitroreductase family)
MGILGDLVDRTWPVTRHVLGAHITAYRLSGGLVGHHVPGAPPMLLLDHVGAKSGKKRTSPLAYLKDGDDIVIVASKGGYPRNPAWFHNLNANPDTTIQIGRKRRPVHARVAGRRERKRLWPEVVSLYGGYEDYQERTNRQIPLVILEPRSG